MRAPELLKIIFDKLSNEQTGETPFHAPNLPEHDAMHELIFQFEKIDKDLLFELEERYNAAIAAVQEDAFYVGFKTAVQLYFQAISR